MELRDGLGANVLRVWSVASLPIFSMAELSTGKDTAVRLAGAPNGALAPVVDERELRRTFEKRAAQRYIRTIGTQQRQQHSKRAGHTAGKKRSKCISYLAQVPIPAFNGALGGAIRCGHSLHSGGAGGSGYAKGGAGGAGGAAGQSVTGEVSVTMPEL